MIVKALIENTSISDEYAVEHGLSIYIQTGAFKILFDTGKSGAFIDNATKMGVDIKSIDRVVISHGHDDHGGGIRSLLEVNEYAEIYLNKFALGDFFSTRPNGTAYIGLDKEIKNIRQIHLVTDYEKIANTLTLFAGINGRELFSECNRMLLTMRDNIVVPDDFKHEQNLIADEDGKSIIFAGCAHNGIVNILESYYKIRGCYPHAVFGGFHLFSPSTGKSESKEHITALAEKLITTGSLFYTCHCTGSEAYSLLRSFMGEQINTFPTGSCLII